MFNWLKLPAGEKDCIRCGYCVEVCPAHLLPQQLWFYSLANDATALNEQRLFDCIECGACDKACPSEIALSEIFHQAKQAIEQVAIEQHKAERAKQRFEQRNQRIAQLEQAKKQKRLARQQAQKAKAQLVDPVQKALAVANAKHLQPLPASTSIMTASQVDTLKNRIARLSEKLNNTKEGPPRQIMRKTLDNLRQQLNEVQAQPDDSAHVSSDPVEAALQRAKLSPAASQQTLDEIALLEKRITSLQEKLAEKLAKDSQSPAVAIMQKTLASLEQELAEKKQP